jgi:hypothetical protein
MASVSHKDRVENALLYKLPATIINPHLAIIRALTASSNFGLDTKMIKCISQYNRKKTHWAVLIDKSVNASQFVGKSIDIENHSVMTLDLNSSNDYSCTLRIYWLPLGVDIERVKAELRLLFKPEAIEVTKEKYRAEEAKHVENGIIRVRITVKRDLKPNIDAFIGKRALLNSQVRIIRVGDPIFCFYCEQEGHVQANCIEKQRKKELKCSKCQKNGHSVEECSLAKRTATTHDDDEDDDDETFEEDNSSVTPKEPSASRTIMKSAFARNRSSSVSSEPNSNWVKDSNKVDSKNKNKEAVKLFELVNNSNVRHMMTRSQAQNVAKSKTSTSTPKRTIGQTSPLSIANNTSKKPVRSSQEDDYLDALNDTDAIINNTTVIEQNDGKKEAILAQSDSSDAVNKRQTEATTSVDDANAQNDSVMEQNDF